MIKFNLSIDLPYRTSIVIGNPWKEGNEGDSKVQFQKDTMVVFASTENEDIWQGIHSVEILFFIEISL